MRLLVLSIIIIVGIAIVVSVIGGYGLFDPTDSETFPEIQYSSAQTKESIKNGSQDAIKGEESQDNPVQASLVNTGKPALQSVAQPKPVEKQPVQIDKEVVSQFSMACGYFLHGMYEKAQTHYRKMLDNSNASDATKGYCTFYLAECLRELGKKDEAADLYMVVFDDYENIEVYKAQKKTEEEILTGQNRQKIPEVLGIAEDVWFDLRKFQDGTYKFEKVTGRKLAMIRLSEMDMISKVNEKR